MTEKRTLMLLVLAVDHNNSNNNFLVTLFSFFIFFLSITGIRDLNSRNRHIPHLNHTVNLHTNIIFHWFHCQYYTPDNIHTHLTNYTPHTISWLVSLFSKTFKMLDRISFTKQFPQPSFNFFKLLVYVYVI